MNIPHKYYWSGINNDERIKAISEITTLVTKHATILNFQKFSDISIGLQLELDESRLSDLHKDLEKIMSIEGTYEDSADLKESCIVHLHVTFTRGTGNLVIEVPDIPE